MKPNYFKLRIANDYQRTINEFGALKIAYTATSALTPLPNDWKGNHVYLFNMSGTETVELALTINAAAEIDRSVVATTLGASTKVGLPIPPNTMLRLELEMTQVSETINLVHEGSGAGTLYAVRGS